MAVKFYTEKRLDKNGDAAIRISISFQGVRFMSSSGFSIEPDKWDNKRQKVKHGQQNNKGIPYNIINSQLRKMEEFFENYQSDIIKKNTIITKNDIKDIFQITFKKGKTSLTYCKGDPEDFKASYSHFLRENSALNNWAALTLINFKTLEHRIFEFRKIITFKTFNEEGLIEFINFLRTKRGMRNSTIQKNVRLLKWFLRWATKKGFNTILDFENFKPKFKIAEKRIIFLTWEELMTVYNHVFDASEVRIERIRDVFCFCCFTSLRYSDVYNLKKSNIGNNAIHLTTVKTSGSLIIELNQYSSAILNKYKNTNFPKKKALPVINNPKMNDLLKTMGRLCGLDAQQTLTYYKGAQRIEKTYRKYDLITTHTGRRTFICNALALGIAPQIVMKWTGHRDYAAMKPYIDIADEIKCLAMNKFNKG